jgi:GNAT superfamily N-acetyltransferase
MNAGDRERALRAERVEHAATRDMVTAAGPEVAARLGLTLDHVGGADALACTGSGDVILNRVMGLGVEAPARQEEIAALAAHYRGRGVARYIVHVSPVARPAELEGWLGAAGFTPFRRAWMKFALAAARAPAAVPAMNGLELREIGAAQGDAFAALVTRVFDMGGCEALFAPLPGRAGWHMWIAYDGDTPAATAGMFAAGGDTWFGFGACDSAYRGRGAQTALLAARARRAAELGCRDCFTETGEAVPGEAQTSYRNIERAGFEPFYRRPNLLAPA